MNLFEVPVMLKRMTVELLRNFSSSWYLGSQVGQ